MEHVVIIGNGIAGITAARHIRKQTDFRITVISAESKYFWSRTALMYIYMGHMKFRHTKPYEDDFWQKNRIDLIQDYAEHIDHDAKMVRLRKSGNLNYDHLILATGSKPAFFNWEGQDLKGVSGMVSLQDLENIESYTTDIDRAVIVGGGLIGIELAEMLRSRDIKVTFLVREKEFWQNVLPEQEATMISRHIRQHHVDLRLETGLEKILGDETGQVKGVVTSGGENISCQFVGITTGVRPNTDLARASGIPADRGILVNEFLETRFPGVYAIGDCAEHITPRPGRKAVEQVWYTGRIMGETVAATIAGKRTAYQPGPWFNSAKFFDIEYQTYGDVPAETPEHLCDFYWEHEDGHHAVHLIFDRQSLQFCGINSFGIRYRHEYFDQKLHENADIRSVMQDLHKANFDSEFFRDHTKSIQQAFNQRYPDYQVKPIRKKFMGLI